MDQKADHLADDGQTTTRTVMDDSVLEIIGKLIAAAANVIVERVARRRGGSSDIGRFTSILVAFLIFAIRLRVRQASKAEREAVATTVTALRHLAHPPAAWAAP